MKLHTGTQQASFRYLLLCIAIAPLLLACGAREHGEFSIYSIPAKITVPDGEASFIALRVEIPKSFYIYGNPKGPGIGRPTVVTVKAPDFIVFSAARYLPPEKHYSFGDTEHTWIYKHETTIFLPFSVKKGAGPGKTAVSITVDSQLCSSSECILKKNVIPAEIELLPAGTAAQAGDDGLVSLYAQSRSYVDAITDSAAEAPAGEGAPAFGGIEFSPRTSDFSVGGILQAVLFGLLAGLILNVMPCVLPVVSLKIMGFVGHAGKSDRQLRILGALFAAGIMASFAVLASLAAFFDYSWGGLFQHRLFIIIMASVVFALALSLFDVYTLNIPFFAGKAAQNKGNPYLDAFVKGLLATLLATPCSGPFLGGTLAWALTQRPGVIFIIFMSVGAGMAIPYVLLTMNRKLISYIPKPGEWMVTFERIMGFLLIFTVVYLVGILPGHETLSIVTFLSFIALALWQYGKFGAIHRPRVSRIVSAVMLAAIIALGYDFSFPQRETSARVHEESTTGFSPDLLKKNRDSGKTSMVVFTADWCPNCRVVERLSLHTPEVMKEIRDRGVDLMIADITRTNPAASELLKKIGGKSIPYLAVFPAGRDFNRPVVLRDMYSEDDVLRAIRTAAEKQPVR